MQTMPASAQSAAELLYQHVGPPANFSGSWMTQGAVSSVSWRLSRSTALPEASKYRVNALDEYCVLGVQFVSLREAIDSSTAMGKAMFTIIGAMAELEAELISERTTAAMAYTQAHGTRSSKPNRSPAEGVPVRRGRRTTQARKELPGDRRHNGRQRRDDPCRPHKAQRTGLGRARNGLSRNG